MRISDWSSDVCSSDLKWHLSWPVVRCVQPGTAAQYIDRCTSTKGPQWARQTRYLPRENRDRSAEGINSAFQPAWTGSAHPRPPVRQNQEWSNQWLHAAARTDRKQEKKGKSGTER